MGLKELAVKNGKNGNGDDAKVIRIPVERGVITAERRWTKAKEVLAQAKAVIEESEETIERYALPRFRERCRELGRVPASCKVGRIRLTFKGKSQFATSRSLNPDRLKEVFQEDFDKYFLEEQGPVYITPEAMANKEIEKELTTFFKQLQKKYPDVAIIKYDTKVTTKDTLRHDWLVSDEEELAELENKMALAGVKRAKTTFALLE